MMDFSNWSNDNNLIDIPTIGSYFTWSNGRVGSDFIQRRLDRAFCNHLLISSATNMNVSILNRLRSDHFPLLLDFNFSHVQHFSNFRFLGIWTLHDSYEDFIKKVWSTQVIGCPMHILTQKIQILKAELKFWNKQIFGNINLLVKNAFTSLACIQAHLVDNGDNPALKIQEITTQKNLEKLLIMEESYWKYKAKIKWHLKGDRNTSYFHNCAKIRQAKNTLTHIRTNDGTLHDPDVMAAHAISYFTNLFYFAGDQSNEFSMVDEVIPDLVNADMNKI